MSALQNITHLCLIIRNILIGKWHLIQNQPLLREIYKDPPLLSYRKGRSLKNVIVRAKLWRSKFSYPIGVVFGLSFIVIINTMKSFENHRARLHGGATCQRSKINLTVTLGENQGASHKQDPAADLDDWRLRSVISERAGRVTLSVLCT